MRLADKIMKLREDHKVSQKQLAKAMGVSRQTVYKWESGQAYPDIKKAAIILKLYSLTLDQLINDSIDIDSEGYAVRNNAPKETKERPKGFFKKLFGRK